MHADIHNNRLDMLFLTETCMVDTSGCDSPDAVDLESGPCRATPSSRLDYWSWSSSGT